MHHRYSKIKSHDIVTEIDSRSKEHSFRLNLFSKLFCSNIMIMLLVGVIGAQVLSNQDVYAQEFQEGEVSAPEDNGIEPENSVIDEGGVSIADICGDNIDNDADGQMDDLDLEGCVPATGEVGAEDGTTTATGEEGEIATPEDVASSENAVTDTDEGGVSIADICGDNIDNDADGQMDDLDLEGCFPATGEVGAEDGTTTATGEVGEMDNNLKMLNADNAATGEVGAEDGTTTATGEVGAEDGTTTATGEVGAEDGTTTATGEVGAEDGTTTATGEVGAEDGTTTATGEEGEIATPEDVASSENAVTDTDEGGVSIADICGDNIDNDADGQDG